MSGTLQSLGIDKMSVAERVALIKEILDSIAAEPDESALTPEQRAELERRAAASRANPGAGIPWEQIKAEALARFRK